MGTQLGTWRKSVLFQGIMHVLLMCFITSSIIINPFEFAGAQTVPVSALPYMPLPSQLISTSQHSDPPLLRGIQFNTNNLFRFNFIVDLGDTSISTDALKEEASRLIKYFLSSLTIPEEDLWVNLSPYEKDRVIPSELGLTEMGKDLLGEDYILKQLIASLTYPESPLGKQFWNKVYERAFHLFGTTKIPINTFNKIWIVPDKAVVYEDKDRAYIGEARLKVMLEEDYLALQRNLKNPEIKTDTIKDDQTRNINNFSSAIMKEVVLPVIEDEINNGKNFAYLRQIYYSLILAVWFKKKLKETIFEKAYVNKKKIKGVNVSDEMIKEKIYAQYVEAYKKGVYDYIKPNYDPGVKKDLKRRYFSGGADFTKIEIGARSAITTVPYNQLPREQLAGSSSLAVQLTPVTGESQQSTVHSRQTESYGVRNPHDEKKSVSSPVSLERKIRELFLLLGIGRVKMAEVKEQLEEAIRRVVQNVLGNMRNIPRALRNRVLPLMRAVMSERSDLKESADRYRAEAAARAKGYVEEHLKAETPFDDIDLNEALEHIWNVVYSLFADELHLKEDVYWEILQKIVGKARKETGLVNANAGLTFGTELFKGIDKPFTHFLLVAIHELTHNILFAEGLSTAHFDGKIIHEFIADIAILAFLQMTGNAEVAEMWKDFLKYSENLDKIEGNDYLSDEEHAADRAQIEIIFKAIQKYNNYDGNNNLYLSVDWIELFGLALDAVRRGNVQDLHGLVDNVLSHYFRERGEANGQDMNPSLAGIFEGINTGVVRPLKIYRNQLAEIVSPEEIAYIIAKAMLMKQGFNEEKAAGVLGEKRRQMMVEELVATMKWLHPDRMSDTSDTPGLLPRGQHKGFEQAGEKDQASSGITEAVKKEDLAALYRDLKAIHFSTRREADAYIGEKYFGAIAPESRYDDKLPQGIFVPDAVIKQILMVIAGGKPASSMPSLLKRVLSNFVANYPDRFGIAVTPRTLGQTDVRINNIIFYNKSAVLPLSSSIKELGIDFLEGDADDMVKNVIAKHEDTLGILEGYPLSDVKAYIENRDNGRYTDVGETQRWGTYPGNEADFEKAKVAFLEAEKQIEPLFIELEKGASSGLTDMQTQASSGITGTEERGTTARDARLDEGRSGETQPEAQYARRNAQSAGKSAASTVTVKNQLEMDKLRPLNDRYTQSPGYDKITGYMQAAINEFNSNVIKQPLTVEGVMDLYELLRGDRDNEAYAQKERKQRIETLQNVGTDVIKLAIERTDTFEKVLDAAVKLYSAIAFDQIFLDKNGRPLPGFEVGPMHDEYVTKNLIHPGLPADGHYRLAWFVMNFFLMNNNYEPFYFESYDQYRDTIVFVQADVTKKERSFKETLRKYYEKKTSASNSLTAIDITEYQPIIAKGVTSFIQAINGPIDSLIAAIEKQRYSDAQEEIQVFGDILDSQKIQPLFSGLPKDRMSNIVNTIQHNFGNAAQRLSSAIKLKKQIDEQRINLERLMADFGKFSNVRTITLDSHHRNIDQFDTGSEKVDLSAGTTTSSPLSVENILLSLQQKVRTITSKEGPLFVINAQQGDQAGQIAINLKDEAGRTTIEPVVTFRVVASGFSDVRMFLDQVVFAGEDRNFDERDYTNEAMGKQLHALMVELLPEGATMEALINNEITLDAVFDGFTVDTATGNVIRRSDRSAVVALPEVFEKTPVSMWFQHRGAVSIQAGSDRDLDALRYILSSANFEQIVEGFIISFTKELSESSSAIQPEGGINLNAANLNIETRGEGINIPAGSIEIDLEHFEGFSFQIISIEKFKSPDIFTQNSDLDSSVYSLDFATAADDSF